MPRKRSYSGSRTGKRAAALPPGRPRKALDSNADESSNGVASATTAGAAVASLANEDLERYSHKKFKKLAKVQDNLVTPTLTPTPIGGTTSTLTPSPANTPLALPSAVPSTVEGTLTTTTTTTTTTTINNSTAKQQVESAGKYVCSYCQLACAKPSVLQKHIRAHTNERPFPCRPCGFAFKTKSNLYKHRRSRAHAVKLEESAVSAESSSLDDDEDESSSRSQSGTPTPLPNEIAATPTPPPPPPPPSIPQQATTTSTNNPQTNNSPLPPRRAIYKPKFHKANLYVEEDPKERIDNFIAEQEAILEPNGRKWRRPGMPPDTPLNLSKDEVPAVRKRPREIDSLKALIMKELQPTPTKVARLENISGMKLIENSAKDRVLHPENPEGSIIKDLLLKAHQGQSVATAATAATIARTRTPSPSRAAPAPPPQPSPGPLLGKTPLIDGYEESCSRAIRYSDEIAKRTSMHMFGGEVKIFDGLEPRTLRIDANHPGKEMVIPNTGSRVVPEESQVVTIARSGLHSGGTIVQVASKSPRTASPQTVPPSTPPLSSAASKFLVPIMPNITTPNLSIPGIPAPVQLPFQYTSSFNPMTSITAYNPLTLPHVPGMPGPLNLVSSIAPSTLPPQSQPPRPMRVISTEGKRLPLPSPIPQLPPPPSIRIDPPPTSTTTSITTTSSRREIIKLADHQQQLSQPQQQQNNQLLIERQRSPASPKSSSSPISVSVSTAVTTNSLTTTSTATSTSEPTTTITATRPKFLRPTSLPLKPGTFVPKRTHAGMTPGGPVLSLISPETPRPRKSYGQLYLNGHAYTYLGLKCSTRVYFCTVTRTQPMYVEQTPEHQQLSMYSNWKVCSEASPNPLGLDPARAMALYDSRQRVGPVMTISQQGKIPEDGANKLRLTHSSYWTHQKMDISSHGSSPSQSLDSKDASDGSVTSASSNAGNCDTLPKRVRICDGGFESNEDYTYVRGRGRGRYVCEECGIRCKKPSMLKKHIRTHTDVRPFTCRHCNFSFKTKGNLTKHMKSKAHYKRCIDLGLDPVPTAVDDSHIDQESLARQQALRASRGSAESDSDDMDEMDEDDDDDEDEDSGDDSCGEDSGPEREAARGLLSLSEGREGKYVGASASQGLIPSAGLSVRPATYPYLAVCGSPVTLPSDGGTVTAVSAQTELEHVSHSVGVKPEPVFNQAGRCYFPRHRSEEESRPDNSPMDLTTSRPKVPAKDILTPVSEPATLQAICSSIERLPQTPTRINDSTAEGTMLQAYLTEKALQDSRIKQQYRTPPPPPPPPITSLPPSFQIQGTHNSNTFIASSESQPLSPPPVTTAPSTTTTMNHTSIPSSGQEYRVAAAAAAAAAAACAFGKPKAEFIQPYNGPSPSYVSILEDGRSRCLVCDKMFTKQSQLLLHVNIHYFERPFRCEACAVSFRTKGHLQKHERSVSHQNKVSMNSTFGTATTANPRPFKCEDCKIAFRIHGHLAKHLRSKMHIMKLECLGKLPFGTYAHMEREGVSLNEIDTSDCDNSLESLQILAQKLYEKDPSKLTPPSGPWDGETSNGPVGIIGASGDSSDDGGEPLASPPPSSFSDPSSNRYHHPGNPVPYNSEFTDSDGKRILTLSPRHPPPAGPTVFQPHHRPWHSGEVATPALSNIPSQQPLPHGQPPSRAAPSRYDS